MTETSQLAQEGGEAEVRTEGVSIIVPVFNNFESTFACLAHVQKNTLGINYELILADDASTDDLTKLDQDWC